MCKWWTKNEDPALPGDGNGGEPPAAPVVMPTTNPDNAGRATIPEPTPEPPRAGDVIGGLAGAVVAWPTPEIRRVVQSILSVFETGKPAGDYGALVVLADGAGISYGLHQATDRGTNLDRIVLGYLDAGGDLAAELAPFVPRLAADETAELSPGELRPGDDAPAWALQLADLLRRAALDPVMQAVQDRVFDSEYWRPAVNQARELGLSLPLSMAVVYDTAIQSGFEGRGRLSRIRLGFPEVPPARNGDERAWILAYLTERRAWLESLAPGNMPAARSVYRIDVLRGIADADNWGLSVPFKLTEPFEQTTIR